MPESWGWILGGAVWMPLLAAILHPPLAWLFQKGEQRGLGMGLTVGASNLVTALIFLIWLRPDWTTSFGRLDVLAILNGCFFFGGQWFAVKAVKTGDLVVHSSALGSKLIFVGLISATMGLEALGIGMLLAVVLSVMGVFLLSGGDLASWRRHRATVGWTMLGALFFAISDILTSWKAQELGTERWLLVMMVGTGVFSLGILWPRRVAFRKAIENRSARGILLGLGVLMGVQAILINWAFGRFQEPTVSNLVFSLRGLLAIPFLMLLQRSWKGVVDTKVILGSVLMLAALVIAAFV